MSQKNIRLHILVKGRVQGVGFRPFVYNLARKMSISGGVRNTQTGLEIEIEGYKEIVEKFCDKLIKNSPPHAVIEKIEIKKVPIKNNKIFSIYMSTNTGKNYISVPPDLAICTNCKKELMDSSDRRYQYPFINCTNCGPRFSLIHDLPYDRINTTMSLFKMCPDCKKEYKDPVDRRFHAEPDACPNCGPKLVLTDAKGKKIDKNQIKEAVRLLKQGYIVAVKSIGGFHLACDASNNKTVKKLRELKKRPSKPFAIMVKDISHARELCEISKFEEHILLSSAHPIVLLKQKRNKKISPLLAPGNNKLGIMLPYTPLHCLLFFFWDKAILVMTSGNKAEEPISINNENVYEELNGLADFFLIHNRNIYNRCDDSIVQIVEKEIQIIRRSRGYIPLSIPFADYHQSKSVLAFGADSKSSFSILNNREIHISQYIGELNNSKTIDFYKETINRLLNLLKAYPYAVVYDLHPDYISTKLAMEFALSKNLQTIGIQHHEAHVASVMAEYELSAPAIGVAFDGTGFGTDGHNWGGEFFIIRNDSIKRAGHLEYFTLPGGDKATHEIWRIAYALTRKIAGIEKLEFFKKVNKKEVEVIENILINKINLHLTSSIGRLFDAVCAMSGLRNEINYEAQGAIELESLVMKKPNSYYKFNFIAEENIFLIEINELISYIINDIMQKKDLSLISEKFHFTIVKMIVNMCELLREIYNINTVVLSGGVFQNKILISWTVQELNRKKFRSYFNRRIPINDAGISVGQLCLGVKRI
ncbi:MAG: carbamoyltransferase HypF [Candidatus Firestonebacteria bacterium]|nr:carbamoyltransferase HypF [Candidatus Firestonebacteria bacterium]